MQVSVAKNTMTNYLIMLIRMFQGLLVTRWMLVYLGDSGYGLWMLLWTFFGYALLVDFGAGIAGQKYTSLELFRRDIKHYNSIISMIFTFHLLMAFLIVAGTFIASFHLEYLFKVHDPVELAYCRKCFLVFSLSTAVIFPFGVLYEVLVGLHKIYTYAFDLRPHLYTMLEANGFRREATLSEHCFFQGQYKDVVIHSFINKHYEVINYVDCTREQLLEILRMRNLDAIRLWMTNPEVISEENHFNFVERLKGNTDRLYYAIYRNGILVGTYNLTKEKEGVWERGIFANPVTQGKGETEQWERQILADLPEHGIKTLTAKVKLDNPKSIGYHTKLGYKEQSRDNEYIYFLLQLQ